MTFQPPPRRCTRHSTTKAAVLASLSSCSRQDQVPSVSESAFNTTLFRSLQVRCGVTDGTARLLVQRRLLDLLLIIFMGIVGGAMVISLYLPIFQLATGGGRI